MSDRTDAELVELALRFTAGDVVAGGVGTCAVEDGERVRMVQIADTTADAIARGYDLEGLTDELVPPDLRWLRSPRPPSKRARD